MLPQKRPQPDSGPRPPRLSEPEMNVYALVKSKEGSGIWTNDVRKGVLGYTPNVINKALKSLITKGLIKEVSSVKHKTRKIVMGVEFEPSEEISGGTWYQDGVLDLPFIQVLRQQCRRHVEGFKVATSEMIWKVIMEPRNGPSVFKAPITLEQVYDIAEMMVLDGELEKLKSTGAGDSSHVPAGRDCYRVVRGREGPKQGMFSSIPCGVCPRISECTPDGVISPINCVYYDKWLGIDF